MIASLCQLSQFTSDAEPLKSQTQLLRDPSLALSVVDGPQPGYLSKELDESATTPVQLKLRVRSKTSLK